MFSPNDVMTYMYYIIYIMHINLIYFHIFAKTQYIRNYFKLLRKCHFPLKLHVTQDIFMDKQSRLLRIISVQNKIDTQIDW